MDDKVEIKCGGCKTEIKIAKEVLDEGKKISCPLCGLGIVREMNESKKAKNILLG